MNIKYCHTRRAFTLIEIMIAMAILGALVTAIYASWTAILRGAKVGLDAAADVQRTRVAMRTVEEALSSAVMFSTNAYFYGFESDTSGDFAMLSFVSRLPDSFPGGGMFPGQPLRRVTFAVEPNAERVNQLVMRQMPVFQVLEAGEQPYPIVLSRKISQFGLEFWDSKLNDWTYEWVQTNQLPRLVRVSLGFGETRNNRFNAENVAIREIALASVAVAPNQQVGQAAGGGPGGGGAGGGTAGGQGAGGFMPGVGGFVPGGGGAGQVGGPGQGGQGFGPGKGFQPGQGGRPRR